MHDKVMGAGEQALDSTAAEDARDQAQVLRTALDIYPATLTLGELVRELTVASPDFSEQDRIQRAVRDLTAGGLIQRIGDLVLPTRAAVNFNALPRE
jgi:predicted proteasome-type protease